METKRFIGNDMTRIYDKVRREFGPDAVIVRTRTLLREGAEPLIEVVAAPPQPEQELALDMQWTMVDGALGRLQIARPRATVGDLEDMVARDQLPMPRLAVPAEAPAFPAPAAMPAFADEFHSGGLEAAPTAHAPAPVPGRVVRRRQFPSLEALPGDAPPPGEWTGRPRPAAPEWRPAPPARMGAGGPDTTRELLDAGLSEAAARVVIRHGGDGGAQARLAACLRDLPVRYPAEDMRALITMQGPAGAGRTTALMRMALDCADSGRPAALIAADTSRAAAREQMAHYGEAAGLQVYDAATPAEVVQAVMKARPGACLFADIPAGPFALPPITGAAHHAYLALPGHWQREALLKALSDAPKGGFSGCVITHTDLSTDLSPALSLAVEAGMGIAFLSSGRDITAGLDVADPFTLASGLLPTPTGESSNGLLVATA